MPAWCRKPRISWLPGAATGAELEPPVRQLVEVVDALGDLGRVVDLRQRVEDAGADVDALGLGREVAGDDVVGRQVGVLVEEVVLGQPDVLEPGLVGGDHRFDVFEDRVVLGVRVDLAPGVRDEVLDEEAELHRGSSCCIFATDWCRIGTTVLRGERVCPGSPRPRGARSPFSMPSYAGRRTTTPSPTWPRTPASARPPVSASSTSSQTPAGSRAIPANKTYRPGAAMLSAGAAAEEGFAAVHAARPQLAALTAELGVVCTASAVLDGQVTVLARTEPNGRGAPAFRVGQRYPFAPPSGVMFVAWEDDRTVDEWLGEEPLPPLSVNKSELRAVVTSCRARGHLVVGLGESDAGLWALLSDLPDDDLAAQLGVLLQQRMPGGLEPYVIDDVDARRHYDVSLVCGPVFDRTAHMAFLLAVILMRPGVPGRELRNTSPLR